MSLQGSERPAWLDTPRDQRDFRRRVIGVLAVVFQGLHHVDGQRIKWFGEIPYRWAEYSTQRELSTYDGSELTALVIAAHDMALRASIRSSGPGMVRIVLHERKRNGSNVWERHPTLEMASESIRRVWGHWMDEERGS